MESAVNADQNFYSRRPLPNSSSPSPESHQDYHHHQSNLHHLDRTPLQSQLQSPELPPKLPYLTTANLHAVTSNGGFIAGGLSSGGGDPDEFYREYRGVQPSSHNFPDSTVNGMPAITSEVRPSPSSLRSNGNGMTPKHPPLSGARSNLKPSYRSVSAPVDERIALATAKSTSAFNGLGQPGKTSVKDLLKRFDQNNEPSSTTARKPAPRIVTRESSTTGPGYMKDRISYQTRATGNSQTTGTTKAGLSTRDAAPGRVKSPTNSRSTQRTRFATEDQHSNNTLSAAARSTRTRNVVAANSQASKSMTNLSPTSSTPLSQLPSRQPLFGEVLPFEQGSHEAGFGIRSATRRTSDSSLHPSWSHLRSKSNHDVSPSSPTAWYLGVTPDLEDVNPNKPRSSPAHNRNHSDFADHKVNTMNGVNPDFQSPLSLTTSNPETSKSSSRIPLSSRKTSIPSGSSSPNSTRSNSPFATKALANGKARKPGQRPWSPAGRSTTPTNRTTTPTNRSPRGKVRSPPPPNINNSSLKAYISSPPSKASPPLRGSRHRQPVSTATTASSRQKVVDSGGSPKQSRTGMRITRTSGTDEPKPRKIPDGPVNFAERRERIQRAYTKSIHESEQREIRAANLRRLQARSEDKDVLKSNPSSAVQAPAITESPPETEGSSAKPIQPLHISTSFARKEPPPRKIESNGDGLLDSPTLGIPGSFVDDDEAPPSAMSNATGITEFDNEPQTEAARKQLASRPLSSQFIEWNDLSPEQATFGIDHSFDRDDGSIQVMLDASPAEEHIQESTPTNDAFARDPSPPGAFKRDSEYDQPSFITTVTTASPQQTTPEGSRTVTRLESGVDTVDRNERHLHESEEHEIGTSQIHPPPEILFHGDYEPSNHSSEASRIQPTINSTLAPPSMNNVHEYLNTPVSDVGYESSDGYGVTSASEAEYDPYASHPDVQSSARLYRGSHQSGWTDYSVETTDGSSEQGDCHVNSYDIINEDPTKPLPPPKELSPQVPPKPDNYSPQPSPSFLSEVPRLSSPGHHQLPPLSTGDGLGFGLSDRSPRFSGAVALWPEYSPPPPPVPQNSIEPTPAHPTRSPPPPSFYNRRPPSSLYQGSQNGTSRNTESRRASDDIYSPRASISTPRSSTQISLEDVSASQSFEAKEDVYETEEERKAAEKLRKRLFQRRMLMKELIDTESVYLKDMNVVEEIYKGTAEACPKLDTNDIKAIFRNTDEIVAFSTLFLDELKCAISSVYSPRSNRARQSRATTNLSTNTTVDDRLSIAATLADETDEEKDRKTFVGANFGKHLKKMQTVYTDYLKNSELASTRLSALQTDGAVQVWLSECNTVAKDLTAAWDLDALLVKPVQRITRYQLLLAQIQEHTPEDHPDYQALQLTCRELSALLKNIDDLKKRIHMVGKIVGRKRKESDVRSGLAKAFGRRADKLTSSNANRPRDDEDYIKLHEKYGEEYVRLQVVLRDVEYYTREVATYVNTFLRFLSSIELVMRLSASPYPELESKWARFNMSMRDMGTVALEDHVSAVRKSIIEPFEQIIVAYGPPGLAMKKRNKRRLDYEKSLTLKAQGKKLDGHLSELVDQYEALNETLKLELPKLSAMTGEIGKMCLKQFVNIQTNWYSIWQDKVSVVLEANQIPKDIPEIVEMFNRDFPYVETRAQELGIVNGTFLDSGMKTRESSQSTLNDDSSSRKGRPSNLSSRSRGLSLNSDKSPSLPTPDFAKRHSGQFAFSPILATPSAPQFTYQNQPYVTTAHSRTNSGSPATPDLNAFGSRQHVANSTRPNTGRSTSEHIPSRLSTDQYNPQHRRESGSTFNSAHHVDGPPLGLARPYSGLFHSAMPLPDGPEESQRSSRASSRDRNMSGGYNVLYLAASLFEFNISATKSEAGYPYLTYQAGEIFDVIGEKGELWLAKNQDDPSDQVGWIWSKHFARLATD